MDATSLDLSLALTVHEDWLPRSIAMRLYHDLPEPGHEVIEVYEFVHAAAVLEPCACSELDVDHRPLARHTGPIQHEVDLTGLRGERVFLEIAILGEPWAGLRQLAVAPIPPAEPPVPAMLLIDDLLIR
jgi:hypothetical protein